MRYCQPAEALRDVKAEPLAGFARGLDHENRPGLLAMLMFAVTATTSGTQAKKLNVAHRGASAYAPEHTLASYRLALEQGADYVEQDLAVTKDGVLICLHDPTLERTTNVEELFPGRATTVTWEGKTATSWLANDFTLDEIKQLDAGSWFDPKFKGERIPTFDEAVALVKGKAGMFPELKTPEVYARPGRPLRAAGRHGARQARPAWTAVPTRRRRSSCRPSARRARRHWRR